MLIFFFLQFSQLSRDQTNTILLYVSTFLLQVAISNILLPHYLPLFYSLFDSADVSWSGSAPKSACLSVQLCLWNIFSYIPRNTSEVKKNLLLYISKYLYHRTTAPLPSLLVYDMQYSYSMWALYCTKEICQLRNLIDEIGHFLIFFFSV